jgi:hypothetical protein
MDPIAKAAAGTQASQSDWTALKASAGAGELFFEPGAAEKCAKACEDAIGKVDGHLFAAQRLSRVVGFGSPSEGVQLAAKFKAKADEAVSVLRAHRTVLADMRDTYRAAGKAYHEAEVANAREFEANG